MRVYKAIRKDGKKTAKELSLKNSPGVTFVIFRGPPGGQFVTIQL